MATWKWTSHIRDAARQAIWTHRVELCAARGDEVRDSGGISEGGDTLAELVERDDEVVGMNA
jgi:hypothetical protein